MRMVADRSDAIIVNSNHCRDDILNNFNVFPDKVRVIAEGVDEKWSDMKITIKPEDLLAKYGIEGKVILYVGRREPYKNVTGLIHAFSRIPESACSSPHLVIVGADDARYTEPENTVKQLNIQSSVTFTGHVQDEELRSWYRAASAFVLPSLYEGFGLPVLEAFASGVPVISSERSCVPETVGDAGILLDPQEEKDLTSALINVLTDNKLRSELIRKGHRRAKEFNWSNTAAATLKVYEDVCSLT